MEWLLKFLGLGDEGSLSKILHAAISATSGQGVSSTKIVWLSNGMLSCYCATLATAGGVGVYVFLQKADPIYWAGVGALWVNALGFATSAKKNQNQTTKEITLASQPTTGPGATDQGGEK